MAGFGDGFTSGLQMGQQWRRDRNDKKMNEARLELDARRHDEVLAAQRESEGKRMLHDFERMKREQGFSSVEAEKGRGWQGGENERGRTHQSGMQSTAIQSQSNRDFLANIEAERVRSHEALLAAKNSRMVGGGDGLATVEMPLDPSNPNSGKVTAKMPLGAVSGMVNKPTVEAYQSPYASQIADAEKERAKQEIEVAGGDPDTGFFNFKNRADIITQQKTKVMQMKGLELQDKVEKGLMGREAAAAEAARLKQSYGF